MQRSYFEAIASRVNEPRKLLGREQRLESPPAPALQPGNENETH